MVFATDFDPVDSPSPSQRRKISHARITPVHQTNRLIAQAQARKAARTVTSQAVASQQPFQLTAKNGDSEDAADIEVASRIAPVPVSESELVGSAVAPSVMVLRKPKLPLGLKILNQAQHGSTVVMSVLVLGALALYGSSVYVDRSVNRTMSHLNHLQSDSQQLTSANEAIKQSLAEQAMQANSGLEPYEAGDVLFVSPEPRREKKAVSESQKVERFKPIGY